MRWRRARRLSLAAIFGAVALACGPSVQSIYEGNVRFEHCYRLDLDLEIVPTHRRHCWEQWLESYRQGQPRDRVEYARRRLRLFATGDFERPALRLEPSAQPESRVAVVPEPTSVRAPPPALATGAAPASPITVNPSPSADPAPGSACSSECGRSRVQCRGAVCVDATSLGGAGAKACDSCDSDYKACMRRCFE
jgi:hypothetical protein